MKSVILIFLIFNIYYSINDRNGVAAADHDIEQVKSPYVEAKDVGQMMESSHSQHSMRGVSGYPHNTFSTFGLCKSCQNGRRSAASYTTGGGMNGGSAYSSSSSYSYGGGSGFAQPQHSSSRHEVKKEQEFVNGQKIYDFHHEKQYKDGQLINEKRHENGPENTGTQYQSPDNLGYGTARRTGSVQHVSGSEGVPPAQYEAGMHSSFGITPDDDFPEEFRAEIERMHKGLQRNTMAIPSKPSYSSPTYGSHRSEYRYQTKYVNGKPVYLYNEERKYKDGKLIHNVTEEKGPHELGTVDQPFTPPVHRDEYPGSNTPNYHSSRLSNTNTVGTSYRQPPSSASESSSMSLVQSSASRPIHSPHQSSISAYSSSSAYTGSPDQRPYYQNPSSAFSSKATESRHVTQTHPNVYTPYDKHDDMDIPYHQPYKSNSYGTSYHKSTGTVYDTPTERPRYGYKYSSAYERGTSSQRRQPTTHTTDDSTETLHYTGNRGTESRRNPYLPSAPTGRDSYPGVRTDDINEGYERTYYNNRDSYRTGSAPDLEVRPSHYPERSNETHPYATHKIKEESKSSYFTSKTHKQYPDKYYKTVGTYQNQIEKVDQDQHSRNPSYNPESRTTTYSKTQDSVNKYQPYDKSPYDTSLSRQHGIRTRPDSTRDDTERPSSEYYTGPHSSFRPSRTGPSDQDDDDIREVETPSSGIDTPAFQRKPSYNRIAEVKHEQERYDISPYDDASEADKPEEEVNPNNLRFQEYPNHLRNRESPHPDEISRSHSRAQESYYESRRHNISQQPEVLNRGTQRKYSVVNASRTDDRVTTIVPSRWVETTTTWRYRNGKMISETQHRRYFENGIMVYENSTENTRDQMKSNGVNVESLDLTAAQLANYGQTLGSSTHSQKYEHHQIKRFRNGQQTYELNHEKQFQDGNLVHENRDEKDEDDFGVREFNVPIVDDHSLQSQYTDQHMKIGQTEYGTGYSQAIGTNPRSYSRKHEVHEEEEYVNGKKVYDFHHERQYEDGKLVRENKTELGPDDLGTTYQGRTTEAGQSVMARDSLKDLLSGRSQHLLLEQQRNSDNVLSTSCVTCAPIPHGQTDLGRSKTIGTLGSPGYSYPSGSTFRHNQEVEEHYENGQLVKGREETKKWRDGELIDAKSRNYFDGPERHHSTSSNRYSSSSALTSRPVGSTLMREKLDEDCAYNPCKNKGRCKPSVRGPVCVCPFGFKGTYCEEAYCPNRYCRYGGSCSVYEESHTCKCLEGYSGYRCSTKTHRIRLGVSK